MSKELSKKDIAKLALTKVIETPDWTKFPEIIPLGDRYKLPKKLIKKGWFEYGKHLQKEKDYVNAILAFNSARRLDIYDPKIVKILCESINDFYEFYQPRFSREDLVIFKDALDRFMNFYQIRKEKISSDILEHGRLVIRRVDQQIEVAPSKEETPATFKVNTIYNALYDNMTPAELKTELARIIAPTIREMLEEKKNSKKKNKKNTKAKDV
jgi:hypothetical protein